MKTLKIKVALPIVIAASVLRGQTANPQAQNQQQAMLQLLMQMQQAAGAEAATQAHTQPGLSPAQIQQIMQAMSTSGNQDPAATAQLFKTLIAAQTSNVAAPPVATAAPTIVPARQGGQKIYLALHTREAVFVKSKSNDMADALKAEAMSQAINLGATAAARKVAGTIPYFGGMASVLHGGPFGTGAGGKQKGWEFDFVRGLAADAQLKGSDIEFVLPPVTSFPGAAGLPFEPVLLKLKRVDTDKVRILAARKVVLSPKVPSAFSGGAQDPFDHETLSSELETIPVEVQKNADGTSIVKVTRTLAPGDYALAFQKPEPKLLRLLDTVVDFTVIN